jgi:chondroitin polymerizing factor/chondroitin polymerizing factor 2
MNTILGWQIFCPIPFSEYNPFVHGIEQQQFIDVNKKHGRFDSSNTDHISFYVKDYFAGKWTRFIVRGKRD